MGAEYVFGVTAHLRPSGNLRVEPEIFETRLFRPADPPGEEGWLFFRDNLWRGELGDPDHFRGLTEDALGVPVDSVTFRAFETDREYLDALEAAIRAELGLFNADSARETIHKYFGSSIEIR